MGAPIVAWLRQRERADEQIAELRRGWSQRIKTDVVAAWRALTTSGLPVKHTLDDELRARRHYRHSLCRLVFMSWVRVAHHAHLCEVRFVNRNGRRVALRKDVADTLESHLKAWRRWTHLSTEAKRRYGDAAWRTAEKVFTAFRRVVCHARGSSLALVAAILTMPITLTVPAFVNQIVWTGGAPPHAATAGGGALARLL